MQFAMTARRKPLAGSGRALAPDFAGRLVVAQADEDGVAKQAVLGPGQIGDLGDQLRADPMHLREDEPAAEVRRAWRWSRASVFCDMPVPTRPA